MSAVPGGEGEALPPIAVPNATKEGKILFEFPLIEHPCYTAYKIFGDLDCGAPRLLCLHGGPGGGHQTLMPFTRMWPQYGIPVVVYDQIGTGASTHLPETAGNHELWTEKIFLAEVNNLLDALKLRDGPGFHVLGHSWGGMLGSSFAGTQPRGLQRLVLASANASKELSVRSQLIQRTKLPADVQKTLHDKEQSREFDDPDYKAASAVFWRTFMYPGEPRPPEYLASMKNIAEDPTVFRTCQGPSLVLNEGSMRQWTAIPGLPNITAPTLVYNGEFDTSHDVSQQPFFELIPRVRWKTIVGGSHMCHLQPDLQEQVFRMVGDFLTPEKNAERARATSSQYSGMKD